MYLQFRRYKFSDLQYTWCQYIHTYQHTHETYAVSLWESGESSIIISNIILHCAVFSHPNVLRVHPPHLETVIHPAGYYPGSVQVKVSAEDLVPVSLNSSEYCDVVFSLREAVD